MLKNLSIRDNLKGREVKWMRNVKAFTSLILIAALVLFTSSIAHALSLPPGNFLIKFNNFETQILETGNELAGIFKVTSITDNTAAQNPLWVDFFSDGSEITGEFGGLIATVIPAGGGGFDIHFTGGVANVYQDYSPEFDATYPGSGVTDGELILQLAFVPGIIPGDFTTTMNANLDSLTSPGTGDGFAYLDVIGGTHAYLFDTDSFLTGNGTYADLFLHSNFDIGDAFGWPVTSYDPIEGNIPEPSTIILLGAGLLGAGIFGRKKLMK